MKNNIDVVNQWVDKSKEDLDMAKRAIAFQPFYTASCCFHCQQSAEKLLKATLIFFEYEITKDLKTHNLNLLVSLLENHIELDFDFHYWIDELNDYGVKPRYPTDTGQPTYSEAEEAILICQKIFDYLIKHLTFQ
ncbi:MAG: HEPN domain-containing protein [Cytophagales bacterium]